jgi:hypothetical protein
LLYLFFHDRCDYCCSNYDSRGVTVVGVVIAVVVFIASRCDNCCSIRCGTVNAVAVIVVVVLTGTVVIVAGVVIAVVVIIAGAARAFFIMYFGLQDTKPPPCPLHLTEQGGSIHCSKLYCHAFYRLVSYILATISIICIMA